MTGLRYADARPAATGGTICVAVEPPIAVITIENPPLNLLTMGMRAELRHIAEQVGCDESVRAVVLGAVGDRAFSAGSDVREFPNDAAAGRRRAEDEHACYDALESMPQPVVAALRGHVLGGGLELALACDFRVAEVHSRLGLPEMRLGVFPAGGGTQRLPEIVGAARAKQMILLGERLGAREAMRIGLVTCVVGKGEADDRARQYAAQLAQQPRLAVQATKRTIAAGVREGRDAGYRAEVEGIARLFESHDTREGIAAFLAKRDPIFEHR